MVKDHPNAEGESVHKMFTEVLKGRPEKIIPTGLTLQRRYLAKEIREFCPPHVRDLACPIPSGKLLSSDMFFT